MGAVVVFLKAFDLLTLPGEVEEHVCEMVGFPGGRGGVITKVIS
jgi:hypothetical protein